MKIDGKSGTRTEIPFSEPVMDFLSALSERIKSDDLLRSDEEIRAFGFWCRRANLERYRNQYTGNDFRLGRGLVFHIAPSNIPAMFAWSMAIGLLAGNSNIIRISSRTAGQGMRLKELIGQMLSEEKKRKAAWPGFPRGEFMIWSALYPTAAAAGNRRRIIPLSAM